MSATQPLVRAHELAMRFDVSRPWLQRVIEGKPRQWLQAVDGVSFEIARGQTLDVTISDIDRAGRYEPTVRMGMNDIRIVKDLYPPRMTLNFALKGADGQVVAEGERKLVDHAFLMGTQINNNDNLRYEKRLIDDWLRKEFRTSAALTSTP